MGTMNEHEKALEAAKVIKEYCKSRPHRRCEECIFVKPNAIWGFSCLIGKPEIRRNCGNWKKQKGNAMTTERAIKALKDIKSMFIGDSPKIALEMAIKALERETQTKRAIEALNEMSAKYAEMYLDTVPDTDDHILDRVRYRAAADIYANAANMVKQLLRGKNCD